MDSAPIDEQQNKKSLRTIPVTITAFVVVVVISIVGFMQFYNANIEEKVYAERLGQMGDVTSQLFTGLEDVVKNEWDTVDVQINYLEGSDLTTTDDLVATMKHAMKMNNFDESQTGFYAVDDKGRYYTETGAKGFMEYMDYVLDEPEEISFISRSVTGNSTKMVFLTRLDEPLELKSEGGNIKIKYYGVTRDMNELNPYFTCEAYDGHNSVYVIGETGTKLFSGDGENLIKGQNIYNVLSRMEYLHDGSLDKACSDLQTNGSAYSNAILDGQEYFYALYQMKNAKWVLCFLVPSQYVAMNTADLVNMTVKLVLAFSLFLLVICSITIFIVLRLKQRQALEIERRNNKALALVNQQLDYKNAELARAVEVAQAARKEADASSKAKSDFLTNMSHDIRTPMNVIVGITNLMEHDGDLSDRLRGYIQKVQLSSHHLLSLINDVLDMSKIESNRVVLERGKVNLASQIGQVDSIIRSQTNEKAQAFDIHVHNIAHEYLIGDSVRLRQILLNILSNATKYTSDGGKISFDVTELPSNDASKAVFEFVVADTGYGMSPEFLDRVFEPFVRAESSVTNKVQGTGLGMAITKNIVELMNGTITAESTLGKGSRFIVRLPMELDPDASYDIEAQSVLLVSTDAELISNTTASVAQTTLDFTIVDTSEEAIDYLAEHDIDVVLVAGHLRDESLAETVRTMRSLEKDITLIFCVDFAQEGEVQKTLEQCDVDGLIPRPFFLSNLELAIARAHSVAAADQEGGTSILRGMRFLCAEDNELNAEILEAILAMYGARCTICKDGKEIVDAFENVKPGDYDAILMDVQMPRMTGYEATQAIRQSSNTLGKTIPIIAMTANAFSDDVQHSIKAGMDAHIAKPLDIAVLEKAVGSFVVPPPPKR